MALWIVNIAMVQDVNNAIVLMSWEAFSLAHPGCSVAEYLIWSGRNSLYMFCPCLNVTFAIAFVMAFIACPSGFLFVCIFQGAVLCILRGAL